jgi:flagellar basal body-associated protein FliL
MERSVKQKQNSKRKIWIMIIKALIVRLIVGIFDIVSVIPIMFQ